MNKTAIIILAAGNSSRLGRPKQLLPYQGKTLLTHIVTEALIASLSPVVVVTGAFQAEISDSLTAEINDPPQGQPIRTVYNPNWETGMASGIVAGLSNVISLHPDTEAVIIAVCDQPYISTLILRRLVEQHATSGKGIIACSYPGSEPTGHAIVGTPVLFGHTYFKELSALSGSEGARQLLKNHPDDLITIPFPKGNIDIDTEEDFQNLSGT